MVHLSRAAKGSSMLPFAVALLLIAIGTAMISLHRRTHRPSGDALDRVIDARIKWAGIFSLFGGVIMIVVLIGRAV